MKQAGGGSISHSHLIVVDRSCMFFQGLVDNLSVLLFLILRFEDLVLLKSLLGHAEVSFGGFVLLLNLLLDLM